MLIHYHHEGIILEDPEEYKIQTLAIGYVLALVIEGL
jgi:hypothetical protein